jgi:hypothetical protein
MGGQCGPRDGVLGVVEGRAEQGEQRQRGQIPAQWPEQITYTIWSTVHGMAVLEVTHLQDFDGDVAGPAEHGICRLLAGLAETGQE